MGTITWAIETGIETQYEEALAKSAKADGCQVYTPKFIPFGEGIYGHQDVPEKLHISMRDSDDRIIFHGSLQGAAYAQEQLNWEVYENSEQLCCKFYYPKLKERLFNFRHVFLPYGCLTFQKEFLLESIGQEDCIFIRPDSNRKIFTGKVIDREHWDVDTKLIGFYDVAPEELCVVAPPRNILAEYRFFVVESKVVTGSLYRENEKSVRRLADQSEMNQAQEMLDFCLKQEFNPDPAWVLDLALTKSGELAILEVGSFSSCGLYAADTDALVRAVNRIQK